MVMLKIMMLMRAPRSPCTSASPQVGHGADYGKDEELDGDGGEDGGDGEDGDGDDGSRVSMYLRVTTCGS